MAIFSRKSKDDEEIPHFNDNFQANAMNLTNQLKKRTTMVKKMSLSNLNDIQLIQGELSDGNLTIVDVSGFVTSGEFSILELKRAIEQIRGTCRKLGGALARLGDRYLIATPNEHMKFSA